MPPSQNSTPKVALRKSLQWFPCLLHFVRSLNNRDKDAFSRYVHVASRTPQHNNLPGREYVTRTQLQFTSGRNDCLPTVKIPETLAVSIIQTILHFKRPAHKQYWHRVQRITQEASGVVELHTVFGECHARAFGCNSFDTMIRLCYCAAGMAYATLLYKHHSSRPCQNSLPS